MRSSCDEIDGLAVAAFAAFGLVGAGLGGGVGVEHIDAELAAADGVIADDDYGDFRFFRGLDHEVHVVVVNVVKDGLRAQLAPDAFNGRDGVGRHSGIHVDGIVVGARADDGDGLECGDVERQRVVGVLEQHDGFVGDVE